MSVLPWFRVTPLSQLVYEEAKLRFSRQWVFVRPIREVLMELYGNSIGKSAPIKSEKIYLNVGYISRQVGCKRKTVLDILNFFLECHIHVTSMSHTCNIKNRILAEINMLSFLKTQTPDSSDNKEEERPGISIGTETDYVENLINQKTEDRLEEEDPEDRGQKKSSEDGNHEEDPRRQKSEDDNKKTEEDSLRSLNTNTKSNSILSEESGESELASLVPVSNAKSGVGRQSNEELINELIHQVESEDGYSKANKRAKSLSAVNGSGQTARAGYSGEPSVRAMYDGSESNGLEGVSEEDWKPKWTMEDLVPAPTKKLFWQTEPVRDKDYEKFLGLYPNPSVTCLKDKLLRELWLEKTLTTTPEIILSGLDSCISLWVEHDFIRRSRTTEKGKIVELRTAKTRFIPDATKWLSMELWDSQRLMEHYKYFKK